MAKPDFKPEWATDDVVLPEAGTDNKQRPQEELRITGYDFRQKPTCQETNWMFNNIYQWIDYLEGLTDAIGITDIASKAEAEAGTINTALMTPLRTRQFSAQYGLGNNSTQAVKYEGVDLDDFKTSGFYDVGDALNGPNGSGDYGFLTVKSRPTDRVWEVEQTLSLVGGVLRAYSRKYNSDTSTWGAWYQFVADDRVVTSGNGLTGGGDLTSDRTIALGTPGTLTDSTGNNVTASSHTHNINLNSFFDGTEQSKTTNGYQKLPGGIILQWGRRSVGDNAYNIYSFPIAFPNTCLNMTTSLELSSPVTGSDVISCFHDIRSKSEFALGVDSSFTTSSVFVYWFAIGY